MLISGGGGGGFTQALLQGKQLGNQARALREQAHQRRQQLALGIGGLGVGAIGALGGLAGTVGNLANQSARTGILQEELGLRKAEEAPVEGSLFGLPPGPVHPRVVSLMIQKAAAEKNPYENKIFVGDQARKRDELMSVPPGVLPEAYKKAAEARINAGGTDPRVEAAMKLMQLESTPEIGPNKFIPGNLSSLDFPARTALLQKIQAAQTVNAADKPALVKETLQRLQEAGQPLYPPPEAFQARPALNAANTPGVFGGVPPMVQEAEQKRMDALRQIYLQMMQQHFPYENQFTVP